MLIPVGYRIRDGAEPNSVTFSPDSRTLAIGYSDSTVRFHNVMSGENIKAILSGHTENVWRVAYNRDGSLLASGSSDKTIRLWDVKRSQSIGPPLGGHESDVFTLAFSPKGDFLASGGWDGKLLFWNLNARDLRLEACRIANRNLTKEEWNRFLPNEPYSTTCNHIPAATDKP